MNNFDDGSNPFADSTARKATTPSPALRQTNDYNPFTTTTTPAQPASPPPQTNTAAFLPSPQPPVYTPEPFKPPPPPASTTVDLTDHNRRQAELDAREKLVTEREQSLTNQGSTGKRDLNNFPPIPHCIPCRPCFYQDIRVEIRNEFQFTVRIAFYIWLFYSLTLLLNMIAGLSYFLSDIAGAVTFGVSIVYFILFIPAAYIFWFRPIYRAFRDDSAVFFMIFFIIDAMLIVTVVLFALGFIEGMCGFFRITGKKTVIKFTMAILGGLWSLIAAAIIVLTIRIHGFYRQSGASIDQAQKEFQTTFVNSPTVRGAAREAASAGINQALNSGDDRQPIY